jgi:transposase-like protein
MDKLVQPLGIIGLSRTQVSTMSKDLDDQVAAFRTRPWPGLRLAHVRRRRRADDEGP